MLRVFVTEMVFRLIAESGRNVFWPLSPTRSLTLLTQGDPYSNSMPAYRSSTFSRTMTMSMF